MRRLKKRTLRHRLEFETALAWVNYRRYRETPALAVEDAVFGGHAPNAKCWGQSALTWGQADLTWGEGEV